MWALAYFLAFIIFRPLVEKISDVVWLAFGERPKAETRADLEFATAVKACAGLRKFGAEWCEATPAFQQMADHLSLAGFRNYVFDRYDGYHGKDVKGIYDSLKIRRKELRRYSRAICWNEWLNIHFRYADDGKTIVRFQAAVLADIPFYI